MSGQLSLLKRQLCAGKARNLGRDKTHCCRASQAVHLVAASLVQWHRRAFPLHTQEESLHMLRNSVIDLVKNGDGVYELPTTMSLLAGPRTGLLLRNFMEPEKRTLTASLAFKRTMSPLPDYIDFTKGRPLALPKPKRDAPVNDVKAWLIASTLADRRGTSTALSHALQKACLKKLPALGERPWPVIKHLFKSDPPKPKHRKRLDTDHIKACLPLTVPPISKPLSWKMYQDGWCQMNDGAFMRPGLCKVDGGLVNRLHLGTAVKKTPSYMDKMEQKRYDDYVKGEISCG